MNNSISHESHESFEKLISNYVKKGYKVVSRTSTSAQLVREKKFSCLLATVTFLFFAIPFFIYLFWYLGKKEQSLYIRVEDKNGDPVIKITNHRGQEWFYKESQPKPKKQRLVTHLPVWVKIILIIGLIAGLLISIGYLIS